MFQGLKLCFLTQSVQLTLSSVQLTLLECVMFYCVYFSKYNRMIGDENNGWKSSCVTDRGYLAGEPGNSPPNMTLAICLKIMEKN